MEDNEDAESTKSEVKLGKLQFKLDYDFQKGEVRPSWAGYLLNVIGSMPWWDFNDTPFFHIFQISEI